MPTKPKLHIPTSLSRLESVTDAASRQITKLNADLEWYRHALGEKSAWADMETERADKAELHFYALKWICCLLGLALVISCTALGFR